MHYFSSIVDVLISSECSIIRVLSGRQHQPHTSPKPLDSPNARRVPTGKFPQYNQKPNAILYRKNNDNRITSYAVYDAHGMIVKRVDMQGKPHRGVPTPHVVEYGRNTSPDGTVRVDTPKGTIPPRPATPDELHYIKED